MEKKNTNYRSWSSRFLIWIILLNLLVAYFIATTPMGFGNSQEMLAIRLTVLTLLTFALFIGGIILTILSVKNKEDKDFKYKFSVYGYPIFILMNLFFTFM